MSKLDARSLIAHLKLLDDITFGNFQRLYMNSNGLWSNFRKKFCSKFRTQPVLLVIISAYLSIFEFVSTDVNLLIVY